MSTVFPVRIAWYLLAAAAAGLLLYIVAPILTPFLLSAVLAYICLPPVGRIARKLPRWLAAALVMALLVFGKLFGFFGVLLALPASAAMLVALRHLRVHHVDSEVYKS